jgi:hypothetical protein
MQLAKDCYEETEGGFVDGDSWRVDLRSLKNRYIDIEQITSQTFQMS